MDARHNVIVVRIFKLPQGFACVVSWPLPEPGLRAFSPSTAEPEPLRVALPYAQFLREHVGAARVAIDLDDGIEWNPLWGELRDLIHH